MKTRTVELAVGIFVILFAAALFLLAMRVSGLAGSTMGESYNLSAKIDNISGLKERAKVTISGVKVGQVSKIELDPLSHRAVVTIAMDKSLTTFNAEQFKQVEANAELVKYLAKKYPIEYLIGHSEYGVFRNSKLWKETNPKYYTGKEDPGSDFMRKVREKLRDLKLKSQP